MSAGMLTVGTDAAGHVTYTLTKNGVRVARQLAMLGEAGQDALVGELLDLEDRRVDR